MSSTADLSPASLKRRFESLMGETFGDDLPLESRDPAGLLDYIIRRQTENLGEPPISQGMKSDLEALTYFQSTYGPERAARMLRYVFETKKGQMKVGSRADSKVEEIDAGHFRSRLDWWHAKIDKEARKEAEREAEREAGVSRTKSGFTFSSSLW